MEKIPFPFNTQIHGIDTRHPCVVRIGPKGERQYISQSPDGLFTSQVLLGGKPPKLIDCIITLLNKQDAPCKTALVIRKNPLLLDKDDYDVLFGPVDSQGRVHKVLTLSLSAETLLAQIGNSGFIGNFRGNLVGTVVGTDCKSQNVKLFNGAKHLFGRTYVDIVIIDKNQKVQMKIPLMYTQREENEQSYLFRSLDEFYQQTGITGLYDLSVEIPLQGYGDFISVLLSHIQKAPQEITWLRQQIEDTFPFSVVPGSIGVATR